MKSRSRVSAVLVLEMIIASGVRAQTAGDVRSVQSGLWSNPATWETFDGSAWVAAIASPGAADGAITVRTPHVVEIANNLTADQIRVDAGAVIVLDDGFTLALSNGLGLDLDISGRLDNGGAVAPAAGATIAFASGSEYRHLFTTTPGAIPIATWDPNSRCSILG